MLGAKDGQRKQDYFSLDLSCECRDIEPNYEPATDLMHPCKIELEVPWAMMKSVTQKILV